MKKIAFIFCLFFCIKSQKSLAQDSIKHAVHFTTGSAALTGADKQAILKVIEDVAPPFLITRIDIAGHTDNSGSTSFNYTLSEKRALAVKDILVEAGIDAGIIFTHFYGETSPVASNDTEEGKGLNRRADIAIRQAEVKIVSDQDTVTSEGPTLPNGNFSALYDMLREPAQEFCIDLDRDTFLVGKKGTIVHYKANTIKKNELPCNCFTLKLNEYYDNSDLIFHNLTTTSDGRPLESGGMVRLEGYCNGKLYELKPGEFFTVMVPSDTLLPDMKLLTANRQNDIDYLNWQLDPANPDMDGFDFKRMRTFCLARSFTGKCHFFFCKIGDFFRGILGERKYKPGDQRNNQESAKEQALVAKYELKGEELGRALRKAENNTDGKGAVKYYVYKNFNWDYRNIDRYMKGIKFIDFIVDLRPDNKTDVKIIFKTSKTVVPCFERSASFIFKNIADGANVWVLGFRYDGHNPDMIMLALKEVNTSEKRTKLEFKTMTIEEFKSAVKVINRR